jgi:hypothetical protein
LRNLDAELQVKYYALAEVKQALRFETDRLVREWGWVEETADGARRGVSPSYLLNALVAWYATRPEEVRDAVMREGRAIVDDHRKLAKPQPCGTHEGRGDLTVREEEARGRKGRRGA